MLKIKIRSLFDYVTMMELVGYSHRTKLKPGSEINFYYQGRRIYATVVEVGNTLLVERNRRVTWT